MERLPIPYNDKSIRICLCFKGIVGFFKCGCKRYLSVVVVDISPHVSSVMKQTAVPTHMLSDGQG